MKRTGFGIVYLILVRSAHRNAVHLKWRRDGVESGRVESAGKCGGEKKHEFSSIECVCMCVCGIRIDARMYI